MQRSPAYEQQLTGYRYTGPRLLVQPRTLVHLCSRSRYTVQTAYRVKTHATSCVAQDSGCGTHMRYDCNMLGSSESHCLTICPFFTRQQKQVVTQILCCLHAVTGYSVRMSAELASWQGKACIAAAYLCFLHKQWYI